MFARLRSLLRVLARRNRVDHDLDEEMSFHIERLTDDLMAQGMSPDEARREARLRFGSVERAKARTREEYGLSFIDELARNLRFTFRGMRRSPLFSVTFLLTLSLCIGFGAAVFSVVHAVLWRPLPYPHPEDLGRVTLYDPAFGKHPGYTSVDGSNWQRVRDDGEPFQRAVFSDWVQGVNLSTAEAATFVRQQRVGAGYFRTLGVSPHLGREFQPDEDVPDGPRVAILSHGLWTRSFGAEPDIVGRAVRLKGETFTVVGVMPSDFRSSAEADVWTPLRPSTQGEGGGDNYHVLVRIPQGMSLEEADARMAAIQPSQAVRQNHPERRFGLVPLHESLSAGMRPPLLVLLGAIGLMLVVGFANLAGLQVARTLARRAEMATRQALGGGAGALVRQAVTENVLLGMLGGAGGLAVAWAGLTGLWAVARTRFSLWQHVTVDATTITTVVVLAFVATLLFGIAPALQGRGRDAHRVLVSGARGGVGGSSHLLRKVLLVGEVAMVTTLLFSAGLLVRSYGHLEGLSPGFDPDGVLTIQYSLDDARYAEAERVHQLFDETLEGIRSIPGVSSAAVALTLPYERPLNLSFRLPGEDQETYHLINAVYVTPEFFRTLEVPLVQGRVFDQGDREGAPIVAVANQALAARDLPSGPALGARLQMGFGRGNDVEVVGLVGNVRQSASWGDASEPVWETPTLYLPAAQASSGFLAGVHVWFSPSWIVRAETVTSDLSSQITGVFDEVAPGLPVARLTTLQSVMDDAFTMPRFEAGFLVVVSLFALLLAGIGLYGLVAHEVLQRRAEMGLRMALGATPASAVWTAGVSGVRLTALGLLVGGLLSAAAARVLAHVIWGVRAYDPVTLAVLVCVLLLLAGTASFLPAARVGRLDPARILREG